MPELGLGLQDPLPNLYPGVHQRLVSPLLWPPTQLQSPLRSLWEPSKSAPWCWCPQHSLLQSSGLHLPLQVEYLLKKVLSSMSLEVGLGELEELLAQEAQAAQTSGGLSVWQFLELFNSGRCLRGVGRDTLSMAIHEVYQELIQDVLKQVRPSWELGKISRRGGGGAGKPLTLLWLAGLPVEARAPEEKLGRTLVPAAAQLPLLFWE